MKTEKNSQDIMGSATYSTKTEYLLNTSEELAAIMLIHWNQPILETTLKQIQYVKRTEKLELTKR